MDQRNFELRSHHHVICRSQRTKFQVLLLKMYLILRAKWVYISLWLALCSCWMRTGSPYVLIFEVPEAPKGPSSIHYGWFCRKTIPDFQMMNLFPLRSIHQARFTLCTKITYYWKSSWPWKMTAESDETPAEPTGAGNRRILTVSSYPCNENVLQQGSNLIDVIQ